MQEQGQAKRDLRILIWKAPLITLSRSPTRIVVLDRVDPLDQEHGQLYLRIFWSTSFFWTM